VTIKFAWDVSGSLPTLLNDGLASYIYGPGSAAVEEIMASGAALYIHRDQLGSTRLVTDTSGKVTTTYQYDPYGNLTAIGGIPSTPFGFAGYYVDAESGLYYLVTRYYDPATGQFVSVDPAVSLSRSPYGYVDGSPLNRRDPYGLWGGWDTVLGAAIGAVVGATVGAASYGISVASGQEKFSWRRFAGATVGGAVGGAVAGACIGTTWVLLAACGGLGGAAGQLATDLINGDQPKADNYLWAIGAGAVGGVVGGKLFKLVGRRPWKLSNIWNPGKNAQRLYGQNLVGAGVAFGSTLFRGLLPRPRKSNPGAARSNQPSGGLASPARRGGVVSTC
jgi:RHS repeat-associated protein